MTNIDYVEHSIDLFENSLLKESAEPFTTVSGLAIKIGYTPHYLGQLFYNLCGITLGQYILKRRLTAAYLLIRDSRKTIADISQHLGWQDYSAFSRAFKKEFGTSAGSIRTNTSRTAPELTWRIRPRDVKTIDTCRQEPRQIHIQPFHVTGLVFFMDQSVKTFHKPWNIYSRYADDIKGLKNPSMTYQCSSWPQENEKTSEGMWILCGKETDPSIIQNPIFFSKQFNGMQALCFEHWGPVESIFQTYTYIWSIFLPSSTCKPIGNFEFQRYGSDPDLIEILIPVEDNASK